ncbi:24000_t:CDS:2 [Entrophospora sp. SA101]|nr:24000_t:CDS:2 [Entrophospora sp. SA101]CAJ0851593.1 13746_t:CDS:2 [Entrophospora sp. SA101]
MTPEITIKHEAEKLLKLHPNLDLDPNSSFQGMQKYDPTKDNVDKPPRHRKLKRKPYRLNSYELEQEALEKAKYDKLKFMKNDEAWKPNSNSNKKVTKNLFRNIRFIRDYTDPIEPGKNKYEVIIYNCSEKEFSDDGKRALLDDKKFLIKLHESKAIIK